MNATPSDPDALLVEVHAAKLLAVSTRTLQAWRRKNFGPPFVRLGRGVRYRRGDLLSWVAAQVRCAAQSG